MKKYLKHQLLQLVRLLNGIVHFQFYIINRKDTQIMEQIAQQEHLLHFLVQMQLQVQVQVQLEHQMQLLIVQ